MIARDVVKLAAGRVTSSAEVKSWLENDELGSWERDAEDMIVRSRERREELGISDEAAASERASRIVVRALRAVLEREKSKRRRG